MIGQLDKIPEPILGASLAALGWLGLCYTALTPRILETESQNVIPACMAQLEAEQDDALETMTRRAENGRQRIVDRLEGEISQKAAKLKELETLSRTARTYSGLLGQSGLSLLAPQLELPEPKPEDLAALRKSIRGARAAIQNLPPISLPRAPDSELLKTCTCAAMQSVAGKRTDYAISLASFRLIEPEAISQTKADMSEALRINACGTPSWERLS